jgi:hypothetical protein
MPKMIQLAYDPAIGPMMIIGISRPHSRAPNGPPGQNGVWLKALVDTGACNSHMSEEIALKIGLNVISQREVATPQGSLQRNGYLGDLYMPFSAEGMAGPPDPSGKPTLAFVPQPRNCSSISDVIFFGLKDRQWPVPRVDAIIGMDVLDLCDLQMHGPSRRFTLSWEDAESSPPGWPGKVADVRAIVHE